MAKAKDTETPEEKPAADAPKVAPGSEAARWEELSKRDAQRASERTATQDKPAK